jgi:hypothetical protein
LNVRKVPFLTLNVWKGAFTNAGMIMLDGALTLPGGGLVRGRGLRHGLPPGPTPAFGLYLGSARAARRHDPALTWPHRWLVWPDFRLPRDPAEAADAVVGTHHRIVALGEDVEVACGGGVGRTGTVLGPSAADTRG